MASTLGRDDTVTFPDLSDPRSFVDGVPHDAFARMRELPGLYWQPTTLATTNGGFWAVTRWADIVRIEKDPATFTSTRGSSYPLMNTPPDNPMAESVIRQDPPRHGRLRRAAARGFAPRVVANFEPWVQGVVSDVVDAIERLDRFDYMTEVARIVPARVTARILGAPAEDEAQLLDLVTRAFETIHQTDGLRPGEGTSARGASIAQEMFDYVARVQELKKQHPADDMVTELDACVQRGELTQQEFLVYMIALIGGGFETTSIALGQSMRMYLEEMEVHDAVRQALDGGLGDRVADEYLRLVSPVMEMARTATRDVEFAGEQIREGDIMVMYYVSANRDTTVFSEPDRFAPWRPETDTLVFGTGPHRCIGAYLAKLEVRLMWEEIHRRGLELRLDGEPRRGWSVHNNQLKSLPVVWA